MYCRKCGNKLEDGALFCTACGARTEELPVSAPALVYATMEAVFAFDENSTYVWAQILTALLALGAAVLYYINTKKDKELDEAA